MATVNHIHVPTYVGASSYRTTWSSLTTSNTDGQPLSIPAMSDRSVQITGTPSGCTVIMQGSNEETPVTWATLHDAGGNVITSTVAGVFFIAENTNHIRPLISGGDGSTDINVIVLGRAT